MKESFFDFDKNEIHKKRTFILALRSPAGYHDDFYIINNKENMLKYDEDDLDYYYDLKCLYLNNAIKKDKEDKKDKRKYYKQVSLFFCSVFIFL